MNNIVTVVASGRVGRVVNNIQIGEIGIMLELAFDGQLWTECYWKSETKEQDHGL